MDLLRERGYTFRDFDEVLEKGGSEREYYAQVADGHEFRVPRGEGERLMNAMGLKSPTQLRQYRALLRLDDAHWQEADDGNLGEGEIRRLQSGESSRSAPERRESVSNPFVGAGQSAAAQPHLGIRATLSPAKRSGAAGGAGADRAGSALAG